MAHKSHEKEVRILKSDISIGRSGVEKKANKSSNTESFYQLPLRISENKGMSSGAKGLYAKLRFDAWGKRYCRTGVGSLASSLGTDEGTIRVWRRELERNNLIEVRPEQRCCCYYFKGRNRREAYIPLLTSVMERRDIGHTQKLVLCLLSYRQKGNDCCWLMQKDMAEELGKSVRTIQRVLKGLKARGMVQIRNRRHNRKYGNKYTLTLGAALGDRIYGSDSHATQSTPLYKKWKAMSCSKARRAKILIKSLSKKQIAAELEQEVVSARLLGIGIREKEVLTLAFIEKHPIASVEQAINNAEILRAYVWQRAVTAGYSRPYFNRAGYVVNALRGARKEGKTVGTTRLFRETRGKYYKFQQQKAEREKQPAKTENQVRDWVIEQKRALGVTA